MSEDPRCCGSGTCIIDNEGRCWCGQQWDGQKMCHPPLAQAGSPGIEDPAEDRQTQRTQQTPRAPDGSGA